MPSQDHLLLQTVRLQPAEEWAFQGEGISFILGQSGVGRHVLGASTRSFAPGDLLILGGAATGKLSPANDCELVFAWFSLRVEHLYPLFDSSEIAALPTLIDGLKGARFYLASDSPARECHRLIGQAPNALNLEHRSQLLRSAAAVLSVELSRVRQQRSGFVRIEEHMVQVFEKLSNAEMLDLSVSELATRFGCSRRHLNRLFHQHFGVSVSTLKMEMRLLKAMSLLRNPNAKVINVAEDCGFNHLGLFNTCFKRRFGCSPGQWRELVGRSQSPPAAPIGGDGTCQLRMIGLCPWTGGSSVNHAAMAPEVQLRRIGSSNRPKLVPTAKAEDAS